MDASLQKFLNEATEQEEALPKVNKCRLILLS